MAVAVAYRLEGTKVNVASPQSRTVYVCDTRTSGHLEELELACAQSNGRFAIKPERFRDKDDSVSSENRGTPQIDWEAVHCVWLLVCHVFNHEDVDFPAEWDRLQSTAAAGAILIRVSTEPAATSNPTYSDGKLILHLCLSTRDVGVAEWVEILDGLADSSVVGDLVNRRSCRLDKYFSCETCEHLVALAVRCQCYLAAYAERRGEVWGPASISVALKEMEWDQFMARGSPAAERVSTILLSQKESVRNKVRGSDWWQIFRKDNPVDVCQSEWGREASGWDGVASLLGLIVAHRDIPEPSNSEHPVANAFVSLRQRLARRRRDL